MRFWRAQGGAFFLQRSILIGVKRFFDLRAGFPGDIGYKKAIAAQAAMKSKEFKHAFLQTNYSCNQCME